MERKIGEIFEYNGEWYQCIEGNSCKECDFRNNNTSGFLCHVINVCLLSNRADKKQVIFKKLEKVGEPYIYSNIATSCYNITLQQYKVFEKPIFTDNSVFSIYNHTKDIIAIEIKQTKEDMEEKKLNLKPFDIQKAKEGKPVCTRDGRKARIICFDRVGDFPIVALTDDRDYKEEGVNLYDINGKGSNECFDLMMLPEKKEGWVNVYKGGLLDTKSYNTRKEAFDKASPEDYVDTIKINWSE